MCRMQLHELFDVNVSNNFCIGVACGGWFRGGICDGIRQPYPEGMFMSSGSDCPPFYTKRLEGSDRVGDDKWAERMGHGGILGKPVMKLHSNVDP